MMKNDIGINAGTIWHILSTNDMLNIRELGELTGYNERNIYLALGWLSRENKIEFILKNEILYFSLNSASSEMYY